MFREFARIGVRNILRRRRVTTVMILSIALSVSLLYTAMSTSASLQHSANVFLKDTLSPFDVTVVSKSFTNPITKETRDWISSLPGVARVMPRIEGLIYMDTGHGRVYALLVGLDLEAERGAGSLNPTVGTVDLSGDGCFLSEDAAKEFNKTAGDRIMIHTSSGLTFLTVRGCGQVIDKGLVGSLVLVSIQHAWEIYPLRYPSNSSNKLLIELTDVFTAPSFVSYLSGVLGRHYGVVNMKTYHLTVASIFLGQARLILFSLVAAASFIAVFRVLSSFASVFAERRRETGIIMAFGASREQLSTLMVVEVGLVGVVGALVGVALGMFIGFVILRSVIAVLMISIVSGGTRYFDAVYFIDPTSLVIAPLFGLGLTMLAGGIPVIRATRASVVSSLREGMDHSDNNGGGIFSPRLRLTLRITLLMTASLLIGAVTVQIVSDLMSLHIVSEDVLRLLSIPAILLLLAALSPRLATMNVLLRSLSSRMGPPVEFLSVRNVRRSGVNAIVLFNLFAAVTVLFIASTNVGPVITISWEQSMGHQTSPANIVVYCQPPSDVQLITQIRSLPEVLAAVPMNQVVEDLYRRSDVELGLIIATTSDDFEQLASIKLLRSVNSSAGFSVIDSPSTCIVSEYLAGVFQLELGYWLRTASGANLTVVGICSSSVPAYVVSVIEPVFIIIGTTTWANYYGAGSFKMSSVLIQSTDPQQTIDTLSGIPGLRPILISSLQADYASALMAVQLIVNAALITLFISAIFSTALSSFSAAAVRRREIGLLLSQGMASSEIGKMVVVENATAVISGLLMGLLGGLFVELAIRDIVLQFSGGAFYLWDPIILTLCVLSAVLSIILSYHVTATVCKNAVVHLMRDTGRH